jgi:pentatricopeptide repeat protein
MIFIEPSFLISLFFKNKYHEKTKRLFKSLKEEKFVVSFMVIAEVLTVLRKLKQNNQQVKNAYYSIINDFSVIDDTPYYEKAFQASLTNEIGFFDNLYYILMKDLKINKIASYDSDFKIFADIEIINNEENDK